MKRSKTLGPRISQTRDGKSPEKNADWEARVVLADEASGVAVPQSEKYGLSNRDETAQQPDAMLMTLDTIAQGSLPLGSLARYEAYKLALISSDQDLQSIAHTLAVFIQDLFIGSSNTTLH